MEQCGTGRAGRKGTQWEHGLVTTREPLDMDHLAYSMNMRIDDTESSAAGLLPTFEQVQPVLHPLCPEPHNGVKMISALQTPALTSRVHVTRRVN